MIAKVESFLFGQLAGRVFSRLAVSAAGAVAGYAAAHGLHVDAGELAVLFSSLANAAYTTIKDWRDKRAAAAAPAPAPAA
jgi:4-hydroxybenzoate polyprenyltransferase